MIPQAGKRLRLLVRDARRARRLDHRLGPDPRVRRRQRRGRDLVGRLLQHAAPWLRTRDSRLAHDRLSHGAPQRRPGGARAASNRSAHRRHSDRHPSAGVRHRDADHLAAAAGRARERHREQHHGGDQAAGAGAVHRRRRHAPARGELPSLRAERFHRHPSGRRDRVLRVHRLRRHLDGRRRNEEPAAQPSARHSRRARDLHA